MYLEEQCQKLVPKDLMNPCPWGWLHDLPKDGCIRGYPEYCSRLRLSLNCQKVGVVVETASPPTTYCAFFFPLTVAEVVPSF